MESPIKNLIIELIQNETDENLLDLILQLLISESDE